MGRSTLRLGRRIGLGAVGVIVAATIDNLPLLFISLFVYGAGTATNLQARYAGADLAPADKRGHGTSMAMVATTIGAVAGPKTAANHAVPMFSQAETAFSWIVDRFNGVAAPNSCGSL